MTSILQDTLDPELLKFYRIRAQQVANVGQAERDLSRTTSIMPSKSLVEFYGIIIDAWNEQERRAGTPDENKVTFREDRPDKAIEFPAVNFELIKRQPGAFSGGAPFEGPVKNLRPIIREEKEDPENPGYALVISGYFYDNLIRFNCWAKTNKEANRLVEHFEDFMEQFSWFFKLQGVDRVLFWRRQADHVVTIDQNEWYCRPLDYFVRTEKMRVQRVKTIEEIMIEYNIKFQ